MLLSDANVVEAIWIGGSELVEAGSCWHPCGNGHDALVSRSGGNYLGGEERGVVRHLGWRCDRIGASLAIAIGRANWNLGECSPVEGDWIHFSRTVAATLLRQHMHNHRPVHGERLHEGLFELRSVVTVENSHVGDPEIFKEAPWLLHKRHHCATQPL